MSAPAPLRPNDPTRLGRYQLLGRLGEGGMGIVYLGRDEDDRLVALKVIRAELAADASFLERFRREAEAARRVARFCTAQVLDVDLGGHDPYLVTEYVEGPTLEAAVQQGGPLPPSSLEGLAVGVAAALTAIHGAGLVHRDLKPGNVLLSSMGPRVIDFGIARGPGFTGTLTHVGVKLGTPAFMAPEQFGDGPLTAAADVFAWGGVVAYAGTARLPFGEGPLTGVAYRVVNEPPDLDGLDGPLRALVEAAMAKDPAARPSAQALLLRLLGGAPLPVVSAAVVPLASSTRAAVTQVLQRVWVEPAVTTPLRPPQPAAAPASPAAATPPAPQALPRDATRTPRQAPAARPQGPPRQQAAPPQQAQAARAPRPQRQGPSPRQQTPVGPQGAPAGWRPAAPQPVRYQQRVPPAQWGAGLPPPAGRRGRRAGPVILVIVMVVLLLSALSHANKMGSNSQGNSPSDQGSSSGVSSGAVSSGTQSLQAPDRLGDFERSGTLSLPSDLQGTVQALQRTLDSPVVAGYQGDQGESELLLLAASAADANQFPAAVRALEAAKARVNPSGARVDFDRGGAGFSCAESDGSASAVCWWDDVTTAGLLVGAPSLDAQALSELADEARTDLEHP